MDIGALLRSRVWSRLRCRGDGSIRDVRLARRRACSGTLDDDVCHTTSVLLVYGIIFEDRIGVFCDDVPRMEEAGDLVTGLARLVPRGLA